MMLPTKTELSEMRTAVSRATLHGEPLPYETLLNYTERLLTLVDCLDTERQTATDLLNSYRAAVVADEAAI